MVFQSVSLDIPTMGVETLNPASSLSPSSSSPSPTIPRSISAEVEPFWETWGSGLAGLSSRETRLQRQVRRVDCLGIECEIYHQEPAGGVQGSSIPYCNSLTARY